MAELKKILEVEDEKLLSKLVSKVLQEENIALELATTFEEAMQALNGDEGYSGLDAYDALLLDMGIHGGGTGADIAKTARERDYKKRIVMFSGADMKDAIEKTQHLDNIGYLQKPAKISNIIPALKGEYTDCAPQS